MPRGSDQDVLKLTSNDRAAYLRARQLLDPLGIPLESVAADYASAKAILGKVTLKEVAEYYLKKNPTKLSCHHQIIIRKPHAFID